MFPYHFQLYNLDIKRDKMNLGRLYYYKEGGGMPPIFKGLITIIVWILFLKGLLSVIWTLYTGFTALFSGKMIPMEAWAGCAAGAFAFILACIAAWIRKKLE